MTPAARQAAAMALLDEIVAGGPAERILTRWGREARFAGSKDRAAVRDLVYDILRQRRSALWASGAGTETGRALVVGLAHLADPASLDTFTGEGHAPPPLDPAERAALRDLSDAPPPVRDDLPEDLYPLFAEALGDRLPQIAAALKLRAPVDLRVNTLRGDADRARAMLADDDIAVDPVPGVATALRVATNPRKVTGSAAYRSGLVELQDAASQAVALAAGAEPGQAVLDLCAGSGGKTLALAAAMAGQGRLVASDINPRRMRDLPGRAARAGARIEIVDAHALDAHGPFDLVLVDAPCSGSGSWRRDPSQKWQVDRARLAQLNATQDTVLDRAASLLRPGGRIAYATCSILPQENEARLAAALARLDGARAGRTHHWLPGDLGDGFYLGEICLDRKPA